MSEHPSEMYWYNMRTGEVEKGYVTPSVDRVGPFATESEAQHALEKLRENSERWDADEREGN